MAIYKVNVDVYVDADSPESASFEVLDNMTYICGLDNSLEHAEVALKGEYVRESET